MAIRDWPAAERPREKLLHQGADQLSDAELLAIFLRTGTPGLSALDMARQLIERFDGLRGLLNASQEDFCSAKGLGEAKFVQLQATLEIGRRHLLEALTEKSALEDPHSVRNYLTMQLREESREVFCCLFLNSRHQVQSFERMFYGTLTSAAVYPREVVRAALKHNAAAVILAHNHPSGVAEPSFSDTNITEQLVAALKLVDIRVLDHFIVGDGETMSFAERGLL